MKIKVDTSAIGRTKWYEYVIRFLFGGLVTTTAGIIGKQFGPAIGGLFLAFPAIFPATTTLIESHEKRKKRQAGFDGTRRGRQASGVDAAGAVLGAIGLIGFATVFQVSIGLISPWLSLALATLAWAVLSFAGWILWRGKFLRMLRARIQHSRPANG